MFLRYPRRLAGAVFTTLLMSAPLTVFAQETTPPTTAPAADPAEIVLSTGESGDKSVWKGGAPSEAVAREGKGSILWRDLEKNPTLTLETTPADWSKFGVLRFWMHSEKANGQKLQLVMPSENPETQGSDYYSVPITVDWQGWGKIEIFLEEPLSSRSPLGWNKIGKMYFSADGWGNKPLADTVLYIDDVRLAKAEPTSDETVLLNKGFVDSDKDGVPDRWRFAPAGNGKTAGAKLEMGADGSVVRLTDKDPQVGVGLSQWVRAQPDRQYAFSASTRGASTWLYLKFYDKDRKPIGTEHRAATPETKEFRKSTVSAPSPLRAHWLEVWVYTTSTGQGEIEIRQPELEDRGAAERPPLPIPDEKAFFEKLNLDFPGMEAVRTAVAAGDWTAAKTAYREYRRTRSPARWYTDPAARPTTASAATDAAGDKILQHIFKSPYGSNAPEVNLGPDINWEFNPLPPSDPNYTREWTYITLNRMHHWETLASAYWKTLDEKYAREWVAQLTDWVADNPVPLNASPGDTLTWRTIESGIRQAGSWPTSYYSFLHSPSFTPEAHYLYAKATLEHAYRLRKVEKDFPNHGGNWVTMEMNGLGTIGVLFPEFKESAEFFKTAVNRMTKELDEQVYPDGAQIELASGYHQVSLNNFATLAKTAKLNDAAIPGDYLDKLKSMYVYNLWLMDQSGVLPPVNDSGPTGVRGILKEASDLWGDAGFKWAVGGMRGDAPIPASHFFPHAGYAVLRGGWRPTDTYLMFDGGPIGSGHWHEDMLNLYLRAFGRTLLTEPGNYQYDKSKWRRYILTTPSHNTILVDGKEQNRGRFAQQLQREPLKNPWMTSPLLDYVAGTYDSGYQATEYVAREYQPYRFVGDLDASVRHTRHVLFLKPYAFVAVDFLQGDGSHRYDAHFHLDAPDAVADAATKAVHTRRDDNIQLGLYPMDPDGLSAKIVKGQEDPVLGWIPNERRPIPTVVYTKQGAAPATFSTVLYPYAGETPAVTFRPLLADQGNVWARLVTTPREQASLLVKRTPDRTAHAIGAEVGLPVTTDAAAAAVRRPAGGSTARAAVYGATRVETPGLALTAAEPVSLVVAADGGKVLVYNASDRPVTVRLQRPAAREARLAPKSWTEVTASGERPAPEPAALFPNVSTAAANAPSYSDYYQANRARSKPGTGAPITVQAERMTLSAGIKQAAKVASEGEAIFLWDTPGQAVEATMEIPMDGFYRIEARYAAQTDTERGLRIDGALPFREADDIAFTSTMGAPPSDGWSNRTDDWRVVRLGAPAVKDGWSVFLPRGKHTIRLVNETGGGLNLDWIRLVPE